MDGRTFAPKSVLLGHEHFIATVIELPPCAAHPSGAILSAGYDRTMSGQTVVKPVINIWEGGAIVGMVTIGDVVKERIMETEAEAEALKAYIAT